MLRFIKKKAEKLLKSAMKENNFNPINETLANDIFVAAYPKSGNTWVQNLIAGILLDSTSEFLTPRLVNELVPDVHAKQYYKRFFDQMVFKTHALPQPEYKKVIHLVRDGRDSLISYHKMGVNKSKDYPHTLEDMVVKGVGLSPSKWHIHTSQWLNNPYNAQIIRIRYEDLLDNGLEEIKKISEFIGVKRSESRLLEILQNNSITELRNRVEKHGMDNDHTWTNKHISTFFRKGIVGDYKDEMSEELIDYFNNEAKEELLFFNYL